jgi:hypothetical protein
MPVHRHLILLCTLLLLAFLTKSQQRRQDTLILHFAFNSHAIQPEDSARLTADPRLSTADFLSITGYTDSVGSGDYNKRLSRDRAAAAFDFLMSGVIRNRANSDRVITKRSPRLHLIAGGIAPTPDRSDADNRRTEIVFRYQTRETAAVPTHGAPATTTNPANHPNATPAAPPTTCLL